MHGIYIRRQKEIHENETQRDKTKENTEERSGDLGDAMRKPNIHINRILEVKEKQWARHNM